MAFDVEAAKADGYTDEEIRQFLESKNEQLPAEKPIERGEEMKGVAEAVAPDALKLAAEIGAGGYALKKVGDIVRGPSAITPPAEPGATSRILSDLTSGAGTAPAVEATPTKTPMGFVDTNAPRMGPAAAPGQPMTQGMARPAMTALPGAGAGPALAPQAPPSSANYMARMTELADRYLPAKAVQAAGQVGRAVAPVARVLGSAPAMGAQMMLHSGGLNTNEEAELARRRQMQPTFTFPQQ